MSVAGSVKYAKMPVFPSNSILLKRSAQLIKTGEKWNLYLVIIINQDINSGH